VLQANTTLIFFRGMMDETGTIRLITSGG
jgi:hypothetical protein